MVSLSKYMRRLCKAKTLILGKGSMVSIFLLKIVFFFKLELYIGFESTNAISKYFSAVFGMQKLFVGSFAKLFAIQTSAEIGMEL